MLGSVTFAAPGTPYAEIADADEGEFRMLAVARAARGRGSGEALVRRCLDRARELGLSGLSMSTQPSMASAHRVYERLGFPRVPERDWEPVPGVTSSPTACASEARGPAPRVPTATGPTVG